MTSPSSERKKMKVYFYVVWWTGVVRRLNTASYWRRRIIDIFSDNHVYPRFHIQSFSTHFSTHCELSLEFEFILKQNSELQYIYIYG